ncbi:YetF domain-containing protein [Paenisporosarcina antarctica]|uniref:DUF421 domain-containing protein n=1 Tax=Paenisporosarcina antarctica TaxID=417367 RepID=A0A4P6ZUD0_9BACL|nr:DUF421 domain-containing protein [Paenisporosarcina antarctica]QBP39827.1 DUF421 domain-containing protein [Paenisporosarcina antarctica]
MNIDDYSFWEMITRTTVTFTVLLFLARVLGKEQLSQLTFFNYVTGITIGSIAGELVAHDDTHYLNGITSLVWWSILTIFVGYITMKSDKLKEILDDKPATVIKDGKILEKELKTSRLPMGDLMMLLRLQGVFSVKEVHYAVLETNGELSIFKKVSQQPATKQDVKASTTIPKYMPSQIISDGKIVKNNLNELNLTEEWVMNELKKQGIQNVKEVFYAEIETDGSLHIDKRDNNQ